MNVVGFMENLKGFADATTKNVTALSKSTSLKIEAKMKIRDLNEEIDNIKREIRKDYEIIGKMFVLELREKVPMDEIKLNNLLSDIDSKNLKIEESNNCIKEIEEDLNEKLEDIDRKKYE